MSFKLQMRTIFLNWSWKTLFSFWLKLVVKTLQLNKSPKGLLLSSPEQNCGTHTHFRTIFKFNWYAVIHCRPLSWRYRKVVVHHETLYEFGTPQTACTSQTCWTLVWLCLLYSYHLYSIVFYKITVNLGYAMSWKKNILKKIFLNSHLLKRNSRTKQSHKQKLHLIVLSLQWKPFLWIKKKSEFQLWTTNKVLILSVT